MRNARREGGGGQRRSGGSVARPLCVDSGDNEDCYAAVSVVACRSMKVLSVGSGNARRFLRYAKHMPTIILL